MGLGTPLAVQWSVPGQGTKIPQAAQCDQNKLKTGLKDGERGYRSAGGGQGRLLCWGDLEVEP